MTSKICRELARRKCDSRRTRTKRARRVDKFSSRYPDLKHFKAILAAETIKALDSDPLSLRKAHARTGFATADSSRIRSVDLDRFTVDCLMSIVNRLAHRIDVAVKVKRMSIFSDARLIATT